MEIQLVFSSISILFILIAIGFFAFHMGGIKREWIPVLSSIVLNITLPCLILMSMQVPLSAERMSDTIAIFLIEAVIYAVSCLIAVVLPYLLHIPRENCGVHRYMVLFSNLGFMGYPICAALYGAESAFYVTLVNIPFGLLAFSLGVYLIKKGSGTVSFRDIMSPGLTASLVGLCFFLTGVVIPYPISTAFDTLGSVTSPLAMVVIGAMIASMSVSSAFRDSKMYVISAVRLLVIPCTVFFILRPFISDPLLLGVPVLLSAMPVAANTVFMAQEYGGDVEAASKGVFLSTILCLITLPILGYMLL
ncbi:MAG: AEC family transporter [Methanomicrobiales archaeon]|nr:AEC family transporter [Methanomicrobiales archaeon]